jgi:hypothetical protein
MQIELTDRLRLQAHIVLGFYDLTSEQDEELIAAWLRKLEEIPDRLYAGASQGYLEVFLTRVLDDLTRERGRAG